MALEDSALALVRYLTLVEDTRGLFFCPHGEVLLVRPEEVHRYMQAVIDDILGAPAVEILISAGAPEPKSRRGDRLAGSVLR